MTFSRYLYIVLIGISGWLIYYINADNSQVDIQVTPDIELPAFSGSELSNTTYDPLGIRNYQIKSTSLEYYSTSGNTTFDAPILFVYREGTLVEWKITSKRGILAKDQVLTLYDDVVAENMLEGASFDTLKTEKLSIHLGTNDFWTDNDVVTKGPQFENFSHALKGNFNAQEAELYNHVQGVYENLIP
ncbi:LPS export ABC transporter periplasmic protein LptC [Vibrio sp. RC27]